MGQHTANSQESNQSTQGSQSHVENANDNKYVKHVLQRPENIRRQRPLECTYFVKIVHQDKQDWTSKTGRIAEDAGEGGVR